ncbi:hypothetical protein GIB67_010893 [Kingdonia uniflora]|uniref:RING-type E3 ubiquitin transferase n=1 Tax=Kingdonia uniflora TaxID=39325 RepID=A0A7J7M4K8_9MAGN|nr:hypothetical protein GIB67_010893 [Kingdonia uniflora]
MSLVRLAEISRKMRPPDVAHNGSFCPAASLKYGNSLQESGVNSAGLLVDTNLDTSIPDTYRAPSTPIPYDTDLGRPQTPPNQESCGNKVDDTITKSIESTQANMLSKYVDFSIEEEDCPICLEEYDEENPIIISSSCTFLNGWKEVTLARMRLGNNFPA